MPIDNDDDLDEEQQPERSGIRQRMSALETERDHFRQEAEQVPQLQRELAFMRAGIDTTDTRLSYFAKGYDGPIEPAAIKEAAMAAGFLEAPQPAATAQDRQGLERMAQAGAGQGGGPIDFPSAIKGAQTPEEVIALWTQSNQ